MKLIELLREPRAEPLLEIGDRCRWSAAISLVQTVVWLAAAKRVRAAPMPSVLVLSFTILAEANAGALKLFHRRISISAPLGVIASAQSSENEESDLQKRMGRDREYPPGNGEHEAPRRPHARSPKAYRASGWKQVEAAKAFHVTQPRISDLLRGKISLFSLDTLVDMVAAAGLHIDMRVMEAA